MRLPRVLMLFAAVVEGVQKPVKPGPRVKVPTWMLEKPPVPGSRTIHLPPLVSGGFCAGRVTPLHDVSHASSITG